MKEAIITSSILVICIALIRRLCRGKISAGLQYALWLIVALRLIVPLITAVAPDFLPESELSIMNVAEKVETRAQDYIQPPEIIGQINVPIGYLPFVNITNEDGPTAVFLAGKVGFGWIDFFKGVWYAGIVIAGIWMIGVNILFAYRLRKNRIKYEKEDFDLPIYYVKELASPCLYGLPGRQAVFVPEEIIEDDEKLRHILAHEYCHYKHRDVFWAALRCVLMTVYWFNPFVWLAAVLSKQDCELACDESAIKVLGEDERIAYGKTLLSLITKRTRASDIVCAATTMTGAGKGIKERIKRIAEKPHRLAIILLPVLMVVGVVIAFTFTQAKETPEDVYPLSEGEGPQTVTTTSFQITIPESLVKQIYCVQENDTDVIMYHKDFDKEVGRFCMLNYWDAVKLADEGEVILIGDYGKNRQLKNHMEGIDENESVTEHKYYSNENVGGTGGVPGTDSNDGSTDVIDDDTTYIIDDGQTSATTESVYEPNGDSFHIPAPEDVDSEFINLPYDENADYSSDKVAGDDNSVSTQDYFSHEVLYGEGTTHTYIPNEVTDDSGSVNVESDYLPNERITVTDEGATAAIEHTYIPNDSVNVSDTDDSEPVNVEGDYLPNEMITVMDGDATESTEHTYIPSDSADVSTIVLPDETISVYSIPRQEYCYLYVPADNSDVEENIRGKLEEVNEELINLCDSVTVLYVSADLMEEILEALVENRSLDVADLSNTSDIAYMLPEVAGLRYSSLEHKDKEPYAATLHYRLLMDDIKLIDNDMLFLNAVLMFSLVENMEKCSFQINGDINEIKYSWSILEDFFTVIDYERDEMEELFGELYPCSATEKEFKELYNRVVEYLNENE